MISLVIRPLINLPAQGTFDGAQARWRHGDADHQSLGRLLERDARDPVIGQALDELAFGIESPADDLADRAGLHQRAHFVRLYEAIPQEGRVLAHAADADKGDIGLAAPGR